jgi:three-Cys-motif partner protein
MAIIDLNVVENPDCHLKCSKELRKERAIDDMCVETLSSIDGLPVRCVGDWAQQKIFHLVQYFGIFSQGMNRKWKGINYIEICSGPGRCINRSTGEEFDGTSLAILKHKNLVYLKKLLFFDFNPEVVANLTERINILKIDKAHAYVGDYYNSSTICSVLKKELPNDHLNLVFIDPTDCSVPFDLVRDIHATINNIDFIINIASGTDFNRNIIRVVEQTDIFKKTKEKYLRFIGSDDFFTDPKLKKLINRSDHKGIRILFREYYEKSLSTLGYCFFAYKHIKHYYDILFATKNDRGLDFWKKVSSIDFKGQREFIF